MKRLLTFILALLVIAALPGVAQAQRVDQLPGVEASPSGERIAAVVNDGIVSTSDIEDRMKLSMLSAGLPDTLEIRERLLPQILRGLIDEQLQQQEAKRLDISIADTELEQMLTHIAHDNNIPGDMRAYVTSHGASAAALEKQIRASLLWNKVVQRELRPHVDVGDDEVDAAIERMRANAGKQEYLAAEIFLAVDNPKDEDQVKQFADNLVQQLKGGANFGAVARQFSQGTGAAAGGDIGWIQEGQLPPELDHVLTMMSPGEISNPVRSASGWHILALREKRIMTMGGTGDAGDIRLSLQQAFRSSRGDAEVAMQESNDLRESVNGCAGFHDMLATKFPAWHWQNVGDVELAKAPALITDKVRDVAVGKATEPIVTDRGILVYVVCGRHVPDITVNRVAIANAIGTEKLELQARRLLRDLRRAAYVDIRLGKGA